MTFSEIYMVQNIKYNMYQVLKLCYKMLNETYFLEQQYDNR